MMGKHKREPFTDDDFWKYSDERVAYEVERFFWLAALLEDPSAMLTAPSADDRLRLDHALVEAFALHLRNLLEFLFDHERVGRVVAEQFCAPGVWKGKRGAKPQVVTDVWGRVGAEVAHLTEIWIPGFDPKKRWPARELAEAVRPILERLSVHALPGRLSPKVLKAIDVKPATTGGNTSLGIGPPRGPECPGMTPVSITGPSQMLSDDEELLKGRKR